MEPKAVVVSLLLSAVLGQGLTLYGEEERQGLIPFPRVGRSFLPVLPETDEWDDDSLAARYVRKMLAPRLGRKKRSAEDLDAPPAAHGQQPEQPPRLLSDFLRASPWALIAYKENAEKKSSSSSNPRSTLAPRLGRKRSDLVLQQAEAEMQKRTNNDLTPRLGRSSSGSNNFASNDADDDSLAAYLQRKRNSNSSLFSPRLGRSAPSDGQQSKQA